jgi:hypothetical protein
MWRGFSEPMPSLFLHVSADKRDGKDHEDGGRMAVLRGRCMFTALHQYLEGTMVSSIVTISGHFWQGQPWKFGCANDRRRPANQPDFQTLSAKSHAGRDLFRTFVDEVL